MTGSNSRKTQTGKTASGLGRRIRAMRKRKHWSRRELSDMTGGYVTAGAIEAWEQGRRTSISISELLLLAKVTRMPPIRLLIDYKAPGDGYCDYPPLRRWHNSDVAYQFLQSIDDIDMRRDLGLPGNPEDMDLSTFGRRLACARHRTGLIVFPSTKREIREWSEDVVKESAIESWESGRRTRITVEALLGLAAAVGWPPICLLVNVFDLDGMCDYPPLQAMANRDVIRLFQAKRYRRTNAQIREDEQRERKRRGASMAMWSLPRDALRFQRRLRGKGNGSSLR